MNRARATVFPAALAASFLLAGCGGPQSSPEGTVRGFLDALEARDTVAMAASFTDATRELVAEIERLSTRAQRGAGPAITIEAWCTAFCGGVVEGSTLDGDGATVGVRIGDVTERIPVTRVGDRWKIDLSGKLAPAVQMLRLAAAADDVGVDGPTADPDGGAPGAEEPDRSP